MHRVLQEDGSFAFADTQPDCYYKLLGGEDYRWVIIMLYIIILYVFLGVYISNVTRSSLCLLWEGVLIVTKESLCSLPRSLWQALLLLQQGNQFLCLYGIFLRIHDRMSIWTGHITNITYNPFYLGLFITLQIHYHMLYTTYTNFGMSIFIVLTVI